MNDKQNERRREILEAALAAFSEKGYDKTSMDEVVQATGLSKGTIYWYFKNKQELFMALMDYVIGNLFIELEEVLHAVQDKPPREAFALAFESANAMLDVNPRFASLTTDFMLQALHYPEMRQKYADFYARYIDQITAVIQHGIDTGTFRPVEPHAAAAALVGLFDGVMLQALVSDEMQLDWSWHFREVLKTAETMFLNGLLKEGDSDGNDD